MARYSAESTGDVIADWHGREERHHWHPDHSVEVIDLRPAVDGVLSDEAADTLLKLMDRQREAGLGEQEKWWWRGFPRRVRVCHVKSRREHWQHMGPGELRLESQIRLEESRHAPTYGDAMALVDQAQQLAFESRGVVVLRLIARLTNGPVEVEARTVERTASGHEQTVCSACRGYFLKGEQMIVRGMQRWHPGCT